MKPASFGAVARAWADYCRDERSLRQAPISAVLLSALAHPRVPGLDLTGDILTDVLEGIAAVVEAWRSITSRAPALSITLRHHEVEDVARRVRAVAELRRRELAGGAR